MGKNWQYAERKSQRDQSSFLGWFQGFFRHKSEFFKSLDAKREDNLKLKEELVAKAEALKESDDWNETSNALKDLQRQWKEVGPVPDKKREVVFKAFKAACDEFFNRRREHSKGVESDYSVNLTKKEDICARLESMAGKPNLEPEEIYGLQDEFNAIGFVPKKAIKGIQKRYQTALNMIIDQAKDFDTDELEELKSLISINKIKSGPHGDQKLFRKEQALKRKIQNLENDISVWKNNMGFFANSKNADELMADFNEKIRKAEVELIELKEEVKRIAYAGE